MMWSYHELDEVRSLQQGVSVDQLRQVQSDFRERDQERHHRDQHQDEGQGALGDIVEPAARCSDTVHDIEVDAHGRS